ncbi:MAG TPA: patatin-like phospholipase family protein [Euzebya sp.]|nr:patatin-like phospholipase family protein [Euzebya sp.]
MSTPTPESLMARSALFGSLPELVRTSVASWMTPVHVPGREWLFREGDHGDAFYVVRSGRLEVIKAGLGSVALLRPGDTLGEVALLEGEVRSAGVRALRDSELLRLDRDGFTALLASPAFSGALLQAMSRRLREAGRQGPPGTHHRPVVAVAHADGVDAAPVLQALTEALRRYGRVTLLTPEDVTADLPARGDVDPEEAVPAELRMARMVDDAEQDATMVVIDAGAATTSWSAVCGRQADQLLLVVGAAGVPAAARTTVWDGAALVPYVPRPPSLALLGRGGGDAPLVYWVRPGWLRTDVARMARRITGRAVGLVLSGGGARGFAHIGVIDALHSSGVVIDRLGGTSVGALISALAASGHSVASMEAICRSELVERRPFGDWTVPRHALIRGRRAVRMLTRMLPTADIRQLLHPWFAVTADLAAATQIVHRDGPVWQAVGFSMSLPGLAPPQRYRGRLVVDGGVLNNLPVDVMCEDRQGPVVGVDVGRDLHLSGGPHGLPLVAETLAATMALGSRGGDAARREIATLLVEPDLDMGLLDWESLGRAVQAGRIATLQALRQATPEALAALGLPT